MLFILCFLLPAVFSGRSDVIPVSNRSNALQQYLCGSNEQPSEQLIPNNTVIQLISSSYVLNASGLCLISDRHNISIISKQPGYAKITCTSSTGLGFVNVNVLNISNIQIFGCGAPILLLTDLIRATSGPYLPNTSYASVVIVNSSVVSLSVVSIMNYYGYAILAVNVYGLSKLSDLMITKSTGLFIGVGSGLMVYYSNEKRPASLTIANSQFIANQLLNYQNCLPVLLSPLLHNNPIPTPYSSALSVVYNRVSQSVLVTLANCSIVKNTGCPVAGVLILYFDSMPNVTTLIANDTLISDNHDIACFCRGIGLTMITYFSTHFTNEYNKSLDLINWSPLSVSKIMINLHVGLDDGKALHENSGVVYLATSCQINGLSVHVTFHKVTFQYNTVGSCIYAETMLGSNNINSLAVHFTDTIVSSNFRSQVTTSYTTGAIMTFVKIAAVYISSTQNGITSFANNLGSAIEAFNTDIYLSGNVLFEYNTASTGAAIKMYSRSHLYLYTNLTAQFRNNSAFKYGGAIYAFNDRVIDSLCAIQVLSSNLSEVVKQGPRLIFHNNKARLDHSSVSATPIYRCEQIQLDISSKNLTYLYNIIFQFEDQHSINSVSSTPARIVQCVNGVPQLSNNGLLDYTLFTYPGRNFNISLAALDVENNGVYTPVQVQFYHIQSNHLDLHPSSWWLSGCQMEQVLDGNPPCTNVSLTIHTKKHDDSCYKLSGGYCTSYTYFSFPESAPNFLAMVKLKRCPPGFQLNESTGICDCSSLIKTMNHAHGFGFTCDIQNSVVKVPSLKPWIGCYKNSDSEGESCEVGISLTCFRGFCDYSVPQWLSGSSNICTESREGVLCGSCIGNYSTVFGSNKCFHCSNWSLFTIAFYAVIGLILVIVLFSFELTISTGTLNGVIFFANMWNTGFLELLRYQNQSIWFDISQIFISLLNLSLGYPLCFYDGMTEIIKSWLQLLFPVYLLLLVVLVVIVSRYSMRVSSLVYSRAVPVLVTVVHLSFFRLFLAVVDAFSVGQIYIAQDNVKYVWLRDGTVPYFSPQHAILTIASFVLAALFIFPYLILFLGSRWWLKVKAINLYFKPVLDAAHGSFKENRQYWFSLRLILLLQQQTIYVALSAYSEALVYWINGPILIVFTIVHTSAWPFKSTAVNIVDGLIMTVLCLVLFACSALALDDNKHLTELFVISFLAIVIFFVFVIILGYHCLLAFLMCCFTRLKSSLAEKAYRFLASFINYQDTSTPAYLPINNERQPTPQFREPLLDASYGSTN